MVVRDLIENNFTLIAQLSKVGLLPFTVIPDFEIYNFYSLLDEDMPKMVRYSLTATEKKVSEKKVRDVVKYMESKI